VRGLEWGVLRQMDGNRLTEDFYGRQNEGEFLQRSVYTISLLTYEQSVKYLLTSATCPSHPGFLLRTVQFFAQDTMFLLIRKTRRVFVNAL